MLSKALEAAMDERFKELVDEEGCAWGMPEEVYNFAKVLIKENDVPQEEIAEDFGDKKANRGSALTIVDNLCVNSDFIDIADIAPETPEEYYGKNKFIQIGDYLVNKLDFGGQAYVFTSNTILDEHLEYSPGARGKTLSPKARAMATKTAKPKIKTSHIH